MAVPKGSKLVYWSQLDKKGKAERFIGFNRPPMEARDGNKSSPCNICENTIKHKSYYYRDPANNKQIAHQKCVESNTTKRISIGDDEIAVKVERHPVPIDVASAKGHQVAEDAILVAEEAIQPLAKMAKPSKSQMNDKIRALIWKLGMQRFEEMLKEGEDIASLL